MVLLLKSGKCLHALSLVTRLYWLIRWVVYDCQFNEQNTHIHFNQDEISVGSSALNLMPRTRKKISKF